MAQEINNGIGMESLRNQVSESSPFCFDNDMLKALDGLNTLVAHEYEDIANSESEVAPSAQEVGTNVVNDLPNYIEGLLFNQSSRITQTANYLDYLDSQIELTNQEIHRLQKHKQSLQAHQDKILDLAAHLMIRSSIKALLGQYGRSFNLRSYQSVEVLADPKDLPSEYQRVQTTIEPNRVELKKALLSGNQIPGCCIVVNTKASWK